MEVYLFAVKFVVELYRRMFLAQFIYKIFQLVFGFGPYYKDTIDLLICL